MHRGQDDGLRAHAHGSHDLPTQPRSAAESKDVVSTSNKLEDNKEENNENEDMFDRVSGCLQEREAATFGAGSAPETAPCFCNSGSAHEGDAVADAVTCTCCWL